jgi:hypothetical protein
LFVFRELRTFLIDGTLIRNMRIVRVGAVGQVKMAATAAAAGRGEKRAKVSNRKCFLECFEQVSFFGGAAFVLNRNAMTGALGAVMPEAKCKGAQAGLPRPCEVSGAAGGGAPFEPAAGRIAARGKPFEPATGGFSG